MEKVGSKPLWFGLPRKFWAAQGCAFFIAMTSSWFGAWTAAYYAAKAAALEAVRPLEQKLLVEEVVNERLRDLGAAKEDKPDPEELRERAERREHAVHTITLEAERRLADLEQRPMIDLRQEVANRVAAQMALPN